jgi:hypothetical protein
VSSSFSLLDTQSFTARADSEVTRSSLSAIILSMDAVISLPMLVSVVPIGSILISASTIC